LENDKIQRWLIYFLTLSAGLMTFGFALHIIFIAFVKYPVSAEALGFAGAILGAMATVGSVYLAIHRQNRLKLIQDFPQVLRAAEGVDRNLHGLIKNIWFCIENNKMNDLMDHLSNFTAISEEFTELSSKVDHKFYWHTLEFVDNVNLLIKEYAGKETQDDLFFRTLFNNMILAHSKIQEYKWAEIKKFEKYMNG
jgi:hypothetical protein